MVRQGCSRVGGRQLTGPIPICLASLVREFEKARIVQDGNVITCGGVTAGIDFALLVAAEVAGMDVAQSIQLGLEYDPAPPFASGHPDNANEQVKLLAGRRYTKSREAYRAALST